MWIVRLNVVSSEGTAPMTDYLLRKRADNSLTSRLKDFGNSSLGLAFSLTVYIIMVDNLNKISVYSTTGLVRRNENIPVTFLGSDEAVANLRARVNATCQYILTTLTVVSAARSTVV